MVELVRMMRRLAGDRSGVTAIEYGMVAALIGVVIIAVLMALGLELNTNFSTIAGSFDGDRPQVTSSGNGGGGGTGFDDELGDDDLSDHSQRDGNQEDPNRSDDTAAGDDQASGDGEALPGSGDGAGEAEAGGSLPRDGAASAEQASGGSGGDQAAGDPLAGGSASGSSGMTGGASRPTGDASGGLVGEPMGQPNGAGAPAEGGTGTGQAAAAESGTSSAAGAPAEAAHGIGSAPQGPPSEIDVAALAFAKGDSSESQAKAAEKPVVAPTAVTGMHGSAAGDEGQDHQSLGFLLLLVGLAAIVLVTWIVIRNHIQESERRRQMEEWQGAKKSKDAAAKIRVIKGGNRAAA
ncbi:MAG: Flp family type IVb pilin [Alphaproteobacteria bacterium]|nr:Flp family type IVb pilin [Alphaproteobacteria bacterium]